MKIVVDSQDVLKMLRACHSWQDSSLEGPFLRLAAATQRVAGKVKASTGPCKLEGIEGVSLCSGFGDDPNDVMLGRKMKFSPVGHLTETYNKVQLIRVLRSITGVGLKESKDSIDYSLAHCNDPIMIWASYDSLWRQLKIDPTVMIQRARRGDPIIEDLDGNWKLELA